MNWKRFTDGTLHMKFNKSGEAKEPIKKLTGEVGESWERKGTSRSHGRKGL